MLPCDTAVRKAENLLSSEDPHREDEVLYSAVTRLAER